MEKIKSNHALAALCLLGAIVVASTGNGGGWLIFAAFLFANVF